MPFLPDVILLGQIPLAFSTLTGLLGGLLAYFLAGWPRTPEGEAARDVILNLLLGGVVAAKLVYVALDPLGYLRNPAALLLFPFGPLALPAGAAGGLAAVAWGLRRNPRWLAVLDRAASPLAAGLAVASAGFKAPGSWAFAPLLAVAAAAAAWLARTPAVATADNAPGHRAAGTVVLCCAALVLADLAHPANSPGGITGLQLVAALAGTAAWLWTRRPQATKDPGTP